ncbi:MAG: ferritin family protein, partial [Thermofilum sp.]
MLSKHPLELPPGRKLSREEVADALRLSIIAELDAISLYLQLARAIEDERFRRVFEDIAREEKTHVGEFLALLKNLDPEQVEELKAGAAEVQELTGIAAPDPPPANGEPFSEEEWRYLRGEFARAAN